MTPPMESKPTAPKVVSGLYVLLAILTAAAYWQLPQLGFITYDDPTYVTQNANVNGGLTARSVKWAFTAMYGSNWHPLTWLSHMLDCEWFGLNPSGHHLVNLGWHLINALLLFAALRSLTGTTWRSWFVAALFAIHPMHVESVAWISERKDVLSTFFFLLALLGYTSYVRKAEAGRQRTEEGKRSTRRGSAVWYGTALLCFILGLLSKPMVVTLPCVLLLLDFWPLRRFEWSCTRDNMNRFTWLVLEKFPFFLLTAASCVLTVIAQSRGGSVAPSGDITLYQRFINSSIAYGWYVWRLFVPTDQAIIYPLWPDRPIWQTAAAALLLAGMTGFTLWQVKRRPWLLFGWGWFLGVLVPVIGLVQVGMQAYADRYTYLSYVGLCLMVVWAATEWLGTSAPGLKALRLLGASLLVSCVVATSHQVHFWKDDETLYRHALAVTKDNFIALNNLGYTLSQRGEHDEAIRLCEAALKIGPRFSEAHNTIGCALLGKKQPELALAAFERAVLYRPNFALYRNNQGTALHELGRYPEAVVAYEAALQLDPDHADAHYNLGNTLGVLGDRTNAITHYEQAIALRPYFADASLNLGFEWLHAGQLAEAKKAFGRALAMNRNCVGAHYGLGQAANDEGDFASAAKHWQLYLNAKPDHAETLNNLAWLLASSPDAALRDGNRAVTLAQRACELTQNATPLFLGTLAAAYAEAGDFPKAITTAESARDLAQKNEQPDIARKNEALLALYRAGKTCRELKPEPPQ